MGRFRSSVTGVALVAIVALVGCLRANTVDCGELSCPETLQCVADRCVTDQQVESCRTADEGSECTADGVINGHCIAGACVDSICGNGIEELGEVCDDGNVVGEDGCSARCDSDETCGNATVDLFREQCDEGIASLSGDGCSSQCAVEYPTWRRETPRDLAARVDHTMVTIPGATASEGSILLFGGTTELAASTSETWLWKGNQWRQLRPRTTPPAVKSPVLVYDEARGRVVLFTGSDQTFAVWDWDGVDWRQRPPVLGQGPKTAIVAGYHAATQKLIVWDGVGSFELTPSGWLKVAGNQPTARTSTVMAYFKRSDAAGELLMFGGRGSSLFDDTWLFDGARWTEAIFTTRPSSRQEAAMTWDPFGSRIVLFGGNGGSGALGDTWIYDGVWRATAASSRPRRGAAIAYDPAGSRVMIHGGQTSGIPPIMYSDQESYSLSWAPVATAPKPTAVCNTTMAYLPAVGASMFNAVDKAWAWDGIQWTNSAPAPQQRCTAAAASAPDGSSVVLFGGNATSTLYWSDTWTWNGKAWVSATPAGPNVRKSHAMALDERAGKTVLFGGLGPAMGQPPVAPLYTDTWEWDGAAWTERVTVNAPPRSGHVLAFDRTTQTLVLFGGADKDGPVSTTFELDGATWIPHVTAHTPDARLPVVMATGSRGRPIILDSSQQTWELQREAGVVDWIRLPTIGAPPVLGSSSMSYDPVRDQLVLVGVASGEVQVWTLTFVSPQPRESCVASEDLDGDRAAGCADPDCWGTCDPQCSPIAAMSCAASRPRCGDGACAAIEDYHVCPGDCPKPP